MTGAGRSWKPRFAVAFDQKSDRVAALRSADSLERVVFEVDRPRLSRLRPRKFKKISAPM